MASRMRVLVLIYLSVSVAHSQGMDPEDEQLIDDYITELMDCRGMPGVILTIARANEVLMTKGYGVANLDTGEPVTVDTVFPVASVSKQFTSILLAKILGEMEGVNWNTPVRDIIGEDFYFEDGYRSNNTNFRDLLAHRTGVPRYDHVWTLEGATVDEIVMEHMRFYESTEPIRTSFMYNNLMYAAAGKAIEALRGNTLLYEDILLEELLQPLNMSSTVFYHRAGPTYEGFVTPYIPDMPNNPYELIENPKDAWRGTGSVAPAAAVCSTASDMTLWLQFVLSGGSSVDGDQLVSPEYMAEVWEPVNAIPPGGVLRKPYMPASYVFPSCALGYSNGYYQEYPVRAHGGDLIGYHSKIFLIPNMDFGLFFSTNYGNHSVERDFVAAFVSDVLLGSEPWITAEKTCEIFENGFNVTLPEPDFAQCPCDTGDIETLSEWLKMLPKASPLYDWMKSECLWRFRQNISLKELPAQQLEIYEGEYGHFGYGNFTIFINDTTQMLEMQYGGLGRFDLYPTEQEHFFLGQGKENAIALYAWPVLFSESVPGSGFIDLARVTEMENQIFERGLLMDEAPPPRIQDCS